VKSSFVICTIRNIFGVLDKEWWDRGVCSRHGREIVV